MDVPVPGDDSELNEGPTMHFPPEDGRKQLYVTLTSSLQASRR